MKTASEYLKQLVDEHPYKQQGNPDSYSDYNQGWSDALDRAEQVMEGAMSDEWNRALSAVMVRLPKELTIETRAGDLQVWELCKSLKK